MKRGATFLPTNLRMDSDWEFSKALVEAIRQLFEDGFGDRLVLGLDWAFESEQGVSTPTTKRLMVCAMFVHAASSLCIYVYPCVAAV